MEFCRSAGDLVTREDLDAASNELEDLSREIAAIHLPPEKEDLEPVQVRLAAVTEQVLAWEAEVQPPASVAELFEPKRIVMADPGDWRSAISMAQPGDHVVLADGSYSGSKLAVSTDFPLAIRAENLLQAKLFCDIDIAGKSIALHGLDISSTHTKGGTAVCLGGSLNSLIRCRVFRKMGHCIDVPGSDLLIAFNDISIWGKQEVPQGGKGPSSWNFAFIHDPDGKGKRNRIVGNYLHHGPLKVPGNYHHYGITGIGVGVNPKDWDKENEWDISWNLMEQTGHGEISIKTGKNRIVGNTLGGHASDKNHISLRSGNSSVVTGNTVLKNGFGYSIVVQGGKHLVAGNVSPMPIIVRWGNFDWNKEPSGDTRYHRAYGVQLASNDAPVTHGHRYSNETGKLKLPPQNCEFSDQGRVTEKGGVGGKKVDLAGVKYVKARKLTRDDVGPMTKVTLSDLDRLSA